MRPWHLGNTTVRSPFRLKDGLNVLANSPLLGKVKGRENENSFARLLNKNGIVNITRESSDASDLGRKWRSALSQLGFIIPEFISEEHNASDGIGEPFTLSLNGKRLIESDTVPAMQECFLRSLAAYYIPSPIEKEYNFPSFSPLRHTLSIMLNLEDKTGDSWLNFLGMSLIVQLSNSNDNIALIADQILSFRKERFDSKNKRQFDQNQLDKAAEEHKYAATTFKDYGDTNFRYLRATGLFQSRGRGLTIIPEKHTFIEQLVNDKYVPNTAVEYINGLCNGAKLPTDNKNTAILVLNDLLKTAKANDIQYDMPNLNLDDVANISIVRHEIEGLLAEKKEEEYAFRQSNEWEEISDYMELLIKRKRSKLLSNGEEIEIPQAEAPAYFEWVLWRAFLAINSLKNKPYDARRFKIDQDFNPVGTAPGNGPDLIFEFQDFTLVVEVTLTDNSRQEAAEGEPVRRHVANIVADTTSHYGKPIFGLFIANKIDSNTAETFRIGVWYKGDDTKMALDIVPLTLDQFRIIFISMFKNNIVNPNYIFELLRECNSLRNNYEAPDWKKSINEIINSKCEQLLS